MPLGPVQLLVVGFDRPDFRGECSPSSSAYARATSSASLTCWSFTKAPTVSSRRLQHSDLTAGDAEGAGARCRRANRPRHDAH